MVEILLFLLEVIEWAEEVLTSSDLCVSQREVVVFDDFGTNGNPGELGFSIVNLLSIGDIFLQALLVRVKDHRFAFKLGSGVGVAWISITCGATARFDHQNKRQACEGLSVSNQCQNVLVEALESLLVSA